MSKVNFQVPRPLKTAQILVLDDVTGQQSDLRSVLSSGRRFSGFMSLNLW